MREHFYRGDVNPRFRMSKRVMSFEELCEVNPDCVIVLDANGAVLYINSSGMALWQFESKQAAIGKPLATFWPTDDQPKISAAIENAAGGSATIEGFCVSPKGNRYWLETRFATLQAEAGGSKRTLCISRDFSASQEAKASLTAEEVQDRAQNALYREIIDSAIETAIIGTDSEGQIILWSQGAHQITGWTDEEMLGKPLATIFTPEDRAAGRPALEMRRADETGRASDVRWHQTKDGRRFFANVAINPILGPAGGYVKSFRDATQQHLTEAALQESQDRYASLFNSIDAGNALLNLCINARDAIPNGGRVTIETDNCAFDEGEARARDLQPGQYVSLCVTDTGVGMTPNVLSRAFEPFFTTKPLGSGTGLGLSMIYGFVRQSGARCAYILKLAAVLPYASICRVLMEKNCHFQQRHGCRRRLGLNRARPCW